MLKIGVDRISNVVMPAGIANYARQFLQRAENANFGLEFYEYGWTYKRFSFADKKESIDFSSMNINVLGPFKENSFLRALYRSANNKYFSYITNRTQLRFFHAFYYRPPSLVTLPFIPVVYDLSHIRCPDAHPVERVRWLNEMESYLLRNPIIHTISEFSKSEIVSIFGVKPSNIHVIEPLIDHFFEEVEPEQNVIIEKYGLKDKRFFITVGTLEPRKNLITLIKAFAMLPKAKRLNFPLVIIGQEGWGKVDLLKGHAALRAEGSVRFLGYVPKRDLRTLYRSALCSCFPTIYEGFGMPAAEALLAGGSVLAADIASLREATKGRAKYISALDIHGWYGELFRSTEKFNDNGSLTFNDDTKQCFMSYQNKILNLYNHFLLSLE